MDKPLKSVPHDQCDASQTYGYLPGLRASPPFARYQIVLLDDRGTWVLATESLPDNATAGSRTGDLSITSPIR